MPAGRQLTGTSRKLLLTVHISSSVGLLGSTAGVLVAATWAATRDDERAAHAMYDLIGVLPFALGIPLSFIALLSGLALGLLSRWGVLRHWWVTAKLALLLCTLLLGAFLSGPSIESAHDATGNGGDDGARWVLVASVALQVALVLTANVLAVFKPGGRTPWRRPITE